MSPAFRCKAALLALLLLVVPVAGQESDPIFVPFVPTPPEVVEAMLKLADVKASDVVFDLGCGDGRIVVEAAKTFKARGVGVDNDPERIKEAEANAKQAGVNNRVKFIEGDLMEADIRQASVVTLYLLSSVNMKLRPKLLKELRPGSRIVSQTFGMGDWKPDKELNVSGHPIYLWIVPPNGVIGGR